MAACGSAVFEESLLDELVADIRSYCAAAEPADGTRREP
jgi:hypothetical protein